MNAQGLVLFVHVAALLAAIATSGLVHFADARLREAETVAAASPWAGLLERGGRVFPAALLVLVASGVYLVQHGWTWGTGWVDAGLVGVGLLFVNGAAVVGARGRALKKALARVPEGPLSPEALRLIHRHPGGVTGWTNTGIAVGVVFGMAVKPGLAGSLVALAVAALLGTFLGLRQHGHA